jgi:hypothetical protein
LRSPSQSQRLPSLRGAAAPHVVMVGAMDGASIRAVIETPIRDEIVEIAAIVVTGMSAAIAVRAVTAASAWRDAAVAVATVTELASAGVIRIVASAPQSVGTMRPVRKARAIATRVDAARVAAATEIATVTAEMPTGATEIAWKQATVPVANPTATTTSEIASTQRQPAAQARRMPKVRTAVASGQHKGPPDQPVVSAVTASNAEVDVVVVGVAAVAGVVARERAQLLSTEVSQAVARTQRGSAGPWASRSAPKALADTEARPRTATTIILHRRTRASTLTTESQVAAGVIIASHANRSTRGERNRLRAQARARMSRSILSAAVRMKRESRASSARTNKAPRGSHQGLRSRPLGTRQALVSQCPVSPPSPVRRRCPISTPSPARHLNHVNPRPSNSAHRLRVAKAARSRLVQRNHTLSGPPPHRTVVATSR